MDNFHFFLLKSPTFVIQKAATPRNGIEFCQKSIGSLKQANWKGQADRKTCRVIVQKCLEGINSVKDARKS